MKVAKRVVLTMVVMSLVLAMGVVATGTEYGEYGVLCCTTSAENSIGCCEHGSISHDNAFEWSGSVEELLEKLNSGYIVPSNVTTTITYSDECCQDCDYVGFVPFFDIPYIKMCIKLGSHTWGAWSPWGQIGSVDHHPIECGRFLVCRVELQTTRICTICSTRESETMWVWLTC